MLLILPEYKNVRVKERLARLLPALLPASVTRTIFLSTYLRMAHGDVLSEQRARQEAGGCLPHLALTQPTREGISQWGIWVAEKFAKMSAFSDTDICLFGRDQE